MPYFAAYVSRFACPFAPCRSSVEAALQFAINSTRRRTHMSVIIAICSANCIFDGYLFRTMKLRDWVGALSDAERGPWPPGRVQKRPRRRHRLGCLPPPRGISRQAVCRCTAVSPVIDGTVGNVIAANPFRQHLWPPRTGNHPTAPAGIIDSGLHKRHIRAFRAIPATDVAPVKSAATRWQRLQSRLIRLRAPSNVQSSQTRRYAADEQYLADQSHGPSRSKQAES
jgi:hypothetical protein